MSTTIIGYAWIPGIETIGVVITRDDITHAYKARIKSVPGDNEEEDLRRIKKLGARIPVSTAIDLISKTGVWVEGAPNDIWKELTISSYEGTDRTKE